MATYKSNAGNILQPGAQINRLSSFNVEGVYGWPGIEAYELVGYVKISNLVADRASYKSFDITVPSPDRRVDDRPTFIGKEMGEIRPAATKTDAHG